MLFFYTSKHILIHFKFRDNIGPQLPGQAPTHAAPPVGYPQYYNQAPMYSTPGMYNMPAPNIMAPPMAPMAPMAPPITSIPPSANLTPVVRKHEDSEAGPDKKPRVDEGEAEVVPDVRIYIYIYNC